MTAIVISRFIFSVPIRDCGHRPLLSIMRLNQAEFLRHFRTLRFGRRPVPPQTHVESLEIAEKLAIRVWLLLLASVAALDLFLMHSGI